MAEPSGTMTSNGRFASDGLTLARYLAVPSGHTPGEVRLPGMILCHGFPVAPIDARHSAGTFPEFVDRIAHDLGWAAMTFTFRGCGASDGDFSVKGWLDDLRAAIDHLVGEVEPSGIWLVGTGVGGSIALCAAADDRRVRGVATLAARADFDDWAAQPRRFLEHARAVGAVHTPQPPRHVDAWARDLQTVRPVECAKRLAPRPLLVMHGDDDDFVPLTDARLIARGHGRAELRVLRGGDHRLRHDPRAVAVLLGWLDRQRNLR